ncbi:alkaline phosphatase [Shewanella surugensis]|uniref:Alkaline phosphatase n=1 Tax=Shewanella surugensis TaxID=212020 RepID=A0ABT0LG06_9GAMM|nr:alkaline phosphatase [Shewanella surugensis]MCL1126631.1 alkaline phosphatase [Shewanella surugensis]
MVKIVIKIKRIALIISCSLMVASVHAAVLPSAQSDSQWFKDSAAHLVEQTEQQTQSRAKNVILFIGDGMGISTLTAARILEGQQKIGNKGGEENFLSFERFPYSGLVKTYNTNQQVPDSAGTMTAMATGVKTKAGVLSVSDVSLRANCLSSKGNELITLVDLANAKGLSTGIVSTARLTHATPAALYAKTPQRQWESDANLSDEAIENGCLDIAYQLVMRDKANALTVALGGGRQNFISEETVDGEDKPGKRQDGLDLTQAWIENFDDAAYIWDQAGFDAVDVESTSHLLGLFNASHMEFEADRQADVAGEPSLTEMTVKSIQMLSKNTDGYLLVVEGGRIDHAHHAGNAQRALYDTIELSNAVRAAVNSTDPDNTLIMVTADHSHTLTIAGYPKRGNPILGLVHNVDGEMAMALDGKPYTTLGYVNGPGAVAGERDDLLLLDTQDLDFMQQALIQKGGETHAGEDVSIHAWGAGAHLVQGAMEQNVVFHIINQAQQLGGTKY